MSIIRPQPITDYGESRTKQSFKDSCDINNILRRAQMQGGLEHVARYAQEYGDFSGWDYTDAMNKIARAKEIFEHLPAQTKKEFNQDPGAFLEFANNPDNQEQLHNLLYQLGAPGVQLPDIDTITDNADPQPDPRPTPEPPVDPGPPDTPGP